MKWDHHFHGAASFKHVTTDGVRVLHLDPDCQVTTHRFAQHNMLLSRVTQSAAVSMKIGSQDFDPFSADPGASLLDTLTREAFTQDLSLREAQ